MTVMMIGGGENVMRWKDGLVLRLSKSFVSIIQSSIFKKVKLYRGHYSPVRGTS